MADTIKQSPAFEQVCPVFLVDDIVKSAEWYRDVLGFKFNRYWGEPPCFVMLARGPVEVFLSGPEEPGQKIMRPNRSHTHAWDAYLRVDNVEALYQEYKGKGVKIVRGPESTSYQMREFEVEDINGYALCFGQDVSPLAPYLLRFAAKLLLLVVLLNVIRYVVPIPLEMPLAAGRMFAVMESHAAYFNTQFTRFDWITSYFYNFMMWLTCTWVFVLIYPRLRGHMVVRSLKVYGLMFLFFASLSAIYMNHYSHPKEFYIYSVVDALIVMPIVAVANGLLYPLVFRQK